MKVLPDLRHVDVHACRKLELNLLLNMHALHDSDHLLPWMLMLKACPSDLCSAVALAVDVQPLSSAGVSSCLQTSNRRALGCSVLLNVNAYRFEWAMQDFRVQRQPASQVGHHKQAIVPSSAI